MKYTILSGFLLLLCIGVAASEKNTIYYSGGKPQFEYEMKDGMLNGAFKAYYENGNIKMKGRFDSNQKMGVWTFWDENGTKRIKRNYLDNYSFELINEWSSDGKPIASKLIDQRNQQFIAARSKEINERQIRYNNRNIISISMNQPVNQLLLGESQFYNLLQAGVANGTISLYKDDNFVNVSDKVSFKLYEQTTPVAYLVKEYLTYTQDHQVMHRKVRAICPVVEVDGERMELGWFYLPDVRKSRNNNEVLEQIATALDRTQFVGTIIKTTMNAEQGWRSIDADELIAVTLNPIDYEGTASLYFLDNPHAAW